MAKKEVLVIASKAKAALKKNKLNVAGDALEGLNDLIYWHIEQASKRCKQNGRKTVRKHDFMA